MGENDNRIRSTPHWEDGPATGPSRHRVARNSAFNLISQGLHAVFNLAVVFILARRLGKETLGEYFAIFALMLVVQLILESGITTVLTMRMVQRPEHWRRTVAEGFGLLLITVGASVGVMTAIGVVWGVSRGDPYAVRAFAAAGVACASIQVVRFGAAIFRAYEQFRQENVVRVVQGSLFAVLVTLLVSTGDGPATPLAMLAVSHVIAATIMTVALHRNLRCIAFSLNPATVRDWLSNAVPVGLGDVVRRMTWQLDTILLSLLQPAAVVGIYSIAYRPLGPLNWLPRAVQTAMFPSIARMAVQDAVALNRTFSTSIRLMWAISLPISTTIFVLAEPLIEILAGKEYLEAAVPMRILIWVSSLSFLSVQFRFLFTALGRERTYVRLVAVVFVLQLVVEAVLIPYWGYLGACLGCVSGEVVFTVAGLAICRRMGVGAIEWRSMLLATLAVAALGCGLWLIRGMALPVLLCIAALATLLYFLVCILGGAIRHQEIRHLYQAMTRPFVTAT